MNLGWSYDERATDLFRRIDRQGWDFEGRDPALMLATESQERLDTLATDGAFTSLARGVRDELRLSLQAPRWFQTTHEGDVKSIGYFSPEFGIAAALPQYSGGLGVLAGDHLKAANDLGLPLTGVGPLLPPRLLPPGAGRARLATGALPAPRPAGHGAVAGQGRPGRGGAGRGAGLRRACGRPRSGGSRSTCSTPTSRTTTTSTGSCAIGSTAVGPRSASARRSCSASAGCAPCAISTSCPRSSTSTRATPGSSPSSASGDPCSTTASASPRRAPPSGPAPCSRPTPRCRPASTASAVTSSRSTSATGAETAG